MRLNHLATGTIRNVEGLEPSTKILMDKRSYDLRPLLCKSSVLPIELQALNIIFIYIMTVKHGFIVYFFGVSIGMMIVA